MTAEQIREGEDPINKLDWQLTGVYDSFAALTSELVVSPNKLAELKIDIIKIHLGVNLFNKGELEVDGVAYKANKLSYHGPNHPNKAAELEMQILPGALKKEGEIVDIKIIRCLLIATYIHDCGYSLQKEGEDKYLIAEELYKDHVERSVSLAPKLLKQIGVEVDNDDLKMISFFIRATNFGPEWDEKVKLGRKMEVDDVAIRLGETVAQADLLAGLAHKDYITVLVRGLYEELQAAYVEGGEMKMLSRDEKGNIAIIDEKTRKPKLAKAKDGAFVTALEASFGEVSEDDPTRLETPTLFKFLQKTGAFMSFQESQVASAIGAADYYSERYGEDGVNKIRVGFKKNQKLVELLAESVGVKEVDPFVIIEGTMWQHIKEWREKLRSESLLLASFKPEETDYLKNHYRVLGKDNGGNIIGRLLTSEIWDTLKHVKIGKTQEALVWFFGLFQEQSRAEHLARIEMSMALGAYVDTKEKTRTWKTIEEGLQVVAEALNVVNKNEGMAKISLNLTVRRNKELVDGEGKPDEEKMVEMAQVVNKAFKKGDIAGISVLGDEQGLPLSRFATFLEAVKCPTLLLISQVNTSESNGNEKDSTNNTLKDIEYISKQLEPKNKQLRLWFQGGLHELTETELTEARELLETMGEIDIILTLGFDRRTQGMTDIKTHPTIRLLDGLLRARKHLATANPFIGESLMLDVLVLRGEGIVTASFTSMLEENGKFGDKGSDNPNIVFLRKVLKQINSGQFEI